MGKTKSTRTGTFKYRPVGTTGDMVELANFKSFEFSSTVPSEDHADSGSEGGTNVYFGNPKHAGKINYGTEKGNDPFEDGGFYEFEAHVDDSGENYVSGVCGLGTREGWGLNVTDAKNYLLFSRDMHVDGQVTYHGDLLTEEEEEEAP